MKRFLLILLSFFMLSTAYAGEYEDAVASGQPVFFYVYVPYCATCKQVDVTYDKLASAYKGKCRFIRIDAETPYGKDLAINMRIMFVPFVRLIDARRQFITGIEPSCLLDYACAEKELKQFLK